jgi:hypothetical protein
LGAENSYSTALGFVGFGMEVGREPMRQAPSEQLGDGPFSQAWDARTALSIEEAIDEALVLADELAIKEF